MISAWWTIGVHMAEAMVGATEESAARRTLNIDNFEASPWIGLTTDTSSYSTPDTNC